MFNENILANHFHLRLMTMCGRLYITDPLNGVLKQNLMKTCLSKSFSVKFLKDILSYNMDKRPPPCSKRELYKN